MEKTTKYVLITVAVLGGGYVVYKVFSPPPPIVVNNTPVSSSNQVNWLDVLSAGIRGFVAGSNDSTRASGEGMSPVPSRPTTAPQTGAVTVDGRSWWYRS